MQYKIYTIPVIEGESETEELNKLLRANKIVKVDKELVTIGDNVFWTFCVQYLLPPLSTPVGEKKERIDYRNVLDEQTFAVFAALRQCRKAIAEEDAVPAFAVFIDAELAEIAKLEEITEKGIASINGIGKQRAEKFGRRIIEKMNETVR